MKCASKACAEDLCPYCSGHYIAMGQACPDPRWCECLPATVFTLLTKAGVKWDVAKAAGNLIARSPQWTGPRRN